MAGLPKGKGSGTIELSTRLELEFVKAALARLFVLFGVHTEVVLRIASGSVSMEEGTVATIEDVDFGKGEEGILVSVLFTVLRANKLGPVAISW